jgi:hypothetical protein
MSTTFGERPFIEYLVVNPSKMKEAQQEAAEFALDFVRRKSSALNGAALSDLWSIFAKSLYGFILRDAGRDSKTGLIGGIVPEMIQASLSRFRQELETAGHELYTQWETNLRSTVDSLYQDSSIIFRSYLQGILSDKFYVDESDADRIVTQLIRQGTIEQAGSRFGVPLLKLSGIQPH